MNNSAQKENFVDPKQTKARGNSINVTYLFNQNDTGNIKKRIFDLLANGKGQLEIKNQTVFLSFSNLYDREQFDAEIQ